ncbi:hypothetical protein GCM10023187_32700 [Nibrella viscosa]|uniref:Tetratricopeptide repeat-containing protein n=1 Tax=Nibrella viscosa TaxID=1084524 RepID=A0ABP8KLD9_9BACT
MNELERIDDYFSGRMTAPERTAFEADLQSDPGLADTTAFYLMTRRAANAESREQRRAEWVTRQNTTPTPTRRLGIWAYASAAAACLLLILGIGWYIRQQNSQPTATALAEAYINRNFSDLGQAMGGTSDSLSMGKAAYNAGKFAEAGALFTAVLQREPDNPDALTFAGIVSLRTEKYDQAIGYFNRLSLLPVYPNTGTFYEALAHLKRNQPMDKNQAEKLLQTVIDKNLAGKKEAEELINAL